MYVRLKFIPKYCTFKAYHAFMQVMLSSRPRTMHISIRSGGFSGPEHTAYWQKSAKASSILPAEICQYAELYAGYKSGGPRTSVFFRTDNLPQHSTYTGL